MRALLQPAAGLSRRVLRGQARTLVPAPSKAWNPEREPPSKSISGTINLSIRLPEEAVLHTQGTAGSTLYDALMAADLNDVWPGGACGGACNCSTCRVEIDVAPAPLLPREDDELDMLDSAAAAISRQADAAGEDGAAVAEVYLADKSRLACQLVLREEDDGLELTLPEDVLNMLEVPLWLRGSR